MKAVIMAGGFGTRLRPLTSKTPKPMVPVANRPMMSWIVDLLKKHDLKDITTILYHQPEVIISHFGDGSRYGVKMEYVTAHRDFGTAGAVKFGSGNLDSTFIVISGDVLTDFDLTEALAFHTEKGAAATILLTRVENPLQYGIVFTDENGRISRFLEKPSWGEVFSDTVNTGIYIIEPDVLELIPQDKEFDFSRDLFPLMMKEGAPLFGYEASGYWRDIGDISVYRKTHNEVLAGKIDLNLEGEWLKTKTGKALIQEGAVLGEGVKFEGVCIVGKGSVLGKGSTLVNSVVGEQCTIYSGAYLRDSIAWSSVEFGEYSHATNSVIASGARVGARSFLMEESIVSEGCSIGEGCTIRANVKLWPDRSVEDGSVVISNLVWGQRWQRQLFSNSRVTGLTNSELNPEFAAKLGAAIGSHLGQGLRVVTARDSHPSSQMIMEALVAGLLSTGIHTSHLRTIPLPLLAFAVRQGEGVIGIYVRRSPFEKKKSDIMFIDDKGAPLGTARIQGIERLFFRGDFRRADMDDTGGIDFPYHVMPAYRKRFLSMIDDEPLRRRPMKIVLDYSYSLASTVLPSILSELGMEVVGINAHPDTEKSVRSRKEFARALFQLSEIVTSIRADLGVLMDVGAEKIFLVDDKGSILSNDQALACTTFLMLEDNADGKFVFSIASSDSLEKMCLTHGVSCAFTADSPTAMINAASKEDPYLVAGRKGGYIFPDFLPVFDAMFSTAMIVSRLAASGKRMSDIVASIPQTYLIRENITCPSARKGRIMRRLMEITENADRTLLDGIKLRTPQGWVLIRPDSYRPILHIDAESDTIEGAEKDVKKYMKIVQSIR